MALIFYHVPWCPECLAVKGRLDALKVSYEDVVVPDTRMFRKQVHAVSGQYYVPVITDGDLVLTETADILAYLDERYRNASGRETRDARPAFKSNARPQDSQPDEPSEEDRYPSCRL